MSDMKDFTALFLDFDGVVRVEDPNVSGWSSGFATDFQADKFRIVKDALIHTQSILVISSDWKDFGYEVVSTILDENGLLDYLHHDWSTPRLTRYPYRRWNEVEMWLAEHQPKGYCILEDMKPNFYGCPPEMNDRIVWTNNRMGLQPGHFAEIITKLNL